MRDDPDALVAGIYPGSDGVRQGCGRFHRPGTGGRKGRSPGRRRQRRDDLGVLAPTQRRGPEAQPMARKFPHGLGQELSQNLRLRMLQLDHVKALFGRTPYVEALYDLLQPVQHFRCTGHRENRIQPVDRHELHAPVGIGRRLLVEDLQSGDDILCLGVDQRIDGQGLFPEDIGIEEFRCPHDRLPHRLRARDDQDVPFGIDRDLLSVRIHALQQSLDVGKPAYSAAVRRSPWDLHATARRPGFPAPAGRRSGRALPCGSSFRRPR